MMTDLDKTNYLIEKYYYNPDTARAYVAAKGYCLYCEEAILKYRTGYSSAAIDHLLPASKYESLISNGTNWVFSCSSCNNMKKAFDPLDNGEDALEMLYSKKEVLIERVRAYLKERIESRTAEFEDVKSLLFDK